MLLLNKKQIPFSKDDYFMKTNKSKNKKYKSEASHSGEKKLDTPSPLSEKISIASGQSGHDFEKLVRLEVENLFKIVSPENLKLKSIEISEKNNEIEKLLIEKANQKFKSNFEKEDFVQELQEEVKKTFEHYFQDHFSQIECDFFTKITQVQKENFEREEEQVLIVKTDQNLIEKSNVKEHEIYYDKQKVEDKINTVFPFQKIHLYEINKNIKKINYDNYYLIGEIKLQIRGIDKAILQICKDLSLFQVFTLEHPILIIIIIDGEGD